MVKKIVHDKRSFLEEGNFFKSLTEKMKEVGKSGADVRWVGSADGKYSVTWKEFVDIAKNAGAYLIDSDLVVVGWSWWIEVVTIENGGDGFKWYDQYLEYKTIPVESPNPKKFSDIRKKIH